MQILDTSAKPRIRSDVALLNSAASSRPRDTASISPKAGTTAPAGSTSILRSPPVMSLTFLAKSRAYSWKMSFCGHVLCQRIVMGPCALATLGKPRAAAPVAATAAPFRNLRRDAAAIAPSALIQHLLLLGRFPSRVVVSEFPRRAAAI